MDILPVDTKKEIFLRTSVNELHTLCTLDTKFKSMCTVELFAERAGVSVATFKEGLDSTVTRCHLSNLERTKELLSDKESFIGSDDHAMMSICYANAIINKDKDTKAYLTRRGVTDQDRTIATFEVAIRTNNFELIEQHNVREIGTWHSMYLFGWACKLRRGDIVTHMLTTSSDKLTYLYILIENGYTSLIESLKDTYGMSRQNIFAHMFVCGLDDYLNSLTGDEAEYSGVDDLYESLKLVLKPGYTISQDVTVPIHRLIYTEDKRLFDVLQPIIDVYMGPESRKQELSFRILESAAGIAIAYDKVQVINRLYDVGVLNKMYEGNLYIRVASAATYQYPDVVKVIYKRTTDNGIREHIIRIYLMYGCIASVRSLLRIHPVDIISDVEITQLSILEYIILCANFDVRFSSARFMLYMDILSKLGIIIRDRGTSKYSKPIDPPVLSNYSMSAYPRTLHKMLSALGMPM